MDKEYVGHARAHACGYIQSGILLSYQKEWNNAICSNMDGPRDYYTKQSKSYKDKHYNITYVWNLRKHDISEFTYKTETDP